MGAMRVWFALALALFLTASGCGDDSGAAQDGGGAEGGGQDGGLCEGCVTPTPDDLDGDGFPNGSDNCPTLGNPDQADAEGDQHGDVCDNCPGVANYDQADADGDGRGDACPVGTDGDGDSVPDGEDNCPGDANPGQRDADADRIGDLCDNCPFFANVDQADANGDGTGDVCAVSGDGDLDGDGVTDGDNCPNQSNADQRDGDGDGVGDACDNCPDVENPFQEDSDQDGTGDHCEAVFDLPPGAPICADGTTASRRLASNIYLLLDISGSMRWTLEDGQDAPTLAESRWGIVSTALDGIADALAAGFNVGMGTFPARCNSPGSRNRCDDMVSICHADRLPDELLAMQSGRDGMVLRDAYAGVEPFGYTPTATALDEVLREGSFNVDGDPFVGQRAAAVVLITDGDPNSPDNVCDSGTDVPNTERAAAALRDAGVPVYVIGIAGVNEANMEGIAVAGGGDNPGDPGRTWYPASDVPSLTRALETIADSTIGCALAVFPTGGETPDWGRATIVMHVGAESTVLARDDYTVSEGDPTVVQLSGQACSDLQDAARAGSEVAIDVRVGCTTGCGDTELCGDGVDNNCDGAIDEGCGPSCVCIEEFEDCGGGCPTGCFPQAEQCDGVDNNCDGTIDEGCCIPEEEVCDGVDNDCDRRADEGCDLELI